MSVRPIWILTLALTLALPLLGGPAEAVPCSESSCRVDARTPGRNDARGLSTLQLRLSELGSWSFGVSQYFPVAQLPPDVAWRRSLRRGLATRDFLLPGLRGRIESTASAEPNLVVNKLPGTARDPGTGASAVPEPTGAVLFASGLIVAATAARRARRPAATLAGASS